MSERILQIILVQELYYLYTNIVILTRKSIDGILLLTILAAI